MKILMLGWELPPHNSGGLGVACLNLSRALVGCGANIDFVVPYQSPEKIEQSIDFCGKNNFGTDETSENDAAMMKIIPALNIDPIFRYGGGAYNTGQIFEKIVPVNGQGGESIMSIRDVQAKYCEFIEKFLMDYRPDVVHMHDWLTFEAGILAKKNYGLPLVAHVHATEYDRSGMHGGNKLIHEIEREGLMLADKIIAVSNITKQIIHEKYGIPLDKIDVLHNSLDESFIQSAYEFNHSKYHYIEKKKAEGYLVVSTVGRFTIQKGLSHLISAAKMVLSKNKKVLFVFAGDGEEKEELIQMATDFGIIQNVIFTGFVRGKKLRDIYELSDVFVMSSISEPFGLTALEAAHHKNVLILTKQSGVSEVLKSVLEYDFWDEKKLADEILAISKSQILKEALRDGLTQEYLKISWGDVAKKCLGIYNKVNKHNRNRRP